MPIDPVKIPQNVYIEDRIVGPLTLRQIITMAIGGGISYSMYASLAKAYGSVDLITTIIVWIPAVIAAAFAIIKINDLTLSRIVLLVVERMLKAPVRTWTPREGISINIKVLATQENEKSMKKVQAQQKADTEAKKKILELSSVVDTAFVEDAPAVEVTDVRSDASPQNIEIEQSAKTVPVDPSRIQADRIRPANRGPSVFHDIIPHRA